MCVCVCACVCVCLKKFRDTKGTFQAILGTKKDRNSMDITEVEDSKKRRQEYTELYERDFIFLGSKITADCDCSHEIKTCFPLEEKLW